MSTLSLFIQKHLPEVFYKQTVLKTFVIFAEKHLWWIHFFNKDAGFMHATLLQNDSNIDAFL